MSVRRELGAAPPTRQGRRPSRLDAVLAAGVAARPRLRSCAPARAGARRRASSTRSRRTRRASCAPCRSSTRSATSPSPRAPRATTTTRRSGCPSPSRRRRTPTAATSTASTMRRGCGTGCARPAALTTPSTGRRCCAATGRRCATGTRAPPRTPRLPCPRSAARSPPGCGRRACRTCRARAAAAADRRHDSRRRQGRLGGGRPGVRAPGPRPDRRLGRAQRHGHDGMFCGAAAFNGDLSGWDVRNVTNMSACFRTPRPSTAT